MVEIEAGGVLPEILRRGPYAVVAERCEDTTLDSTMYVVGFTSAPLFTHFLDPCM